MANRSRVRNCYLRVWVTEVEKETFALIAHTSGLSMSAWIRQLARKSAIRELRDARYNNDVRYNNLADALDHP